ncbi:energy transducer TonB [Dyella jiangningensis]|uniref:Energy transducer TonB n=1 Tax=Dyella jiangningensis TaxID=1379159 RepID=A0A328P0S5_9GAMM|nr:energy transducer TonB [Dyella jiangningensis]RAO75817.1 energy transducer TonB [Dyella jiangningensis]
MSSASLAVPRHAHPDAARIAALSAAIAVNLVALLAVLRPMAPQLMQQMQHISEMTIHWIPAPPKVEPPPDIELKPAPKPMPVPRTHAQPKPVSPPPTITDEGNTAAPPVPPAATPAIEPNVGTAPVEATLAYRAVPLKYPPAALRAHMEGTVILKVLVDEQGVPQEVTVEQSSGYALLDRSARDQVLRGWRFQPATVSGQAVRAWARVPVSFNVNQL